MPKSATTLSRHLITINQAADYLGVSTRTVRRLISSGELAAFRVGNHLVRINPDAIDALLREIPTAGGGPNGAAA